MVGRYRYHFLMSHSFNHCVRYRTAPNIPMLMVGRPRTGTVGYIKSCAKYLIEVVMELPYVNQYCCRYRRHSIVQGRYLRYRYVRDVLYLRLL